MASIYVASKTKHAARWRALRAAGVPIISTWIDDHETGHTSDLGDIWCRSIDEASRATALIVYHEPGETPKGSLVEIGAALAAGTRVYAVGVGADHTWTAHPGVTVCFSLLNALMSSLFAASHEQKMALNWPAIHEVLREPAQSGPSHAPTEPAPPPVHE